jgi:DNA-directed RNA polymerase subunit RPC12/RpoP
MNRMEKPMVCTNQSCRKAFKAVGYTDGSTEHPHGIRCPHCGEPNEVEWPMNTDVAAEKISK